MGPLNFLYLETNLSLLSARLILLSPGLSYFVANLSYPTLGGKSNLTPAIDLFIFIFFVLQI